MKNTQSFRLTGAVDIIDLAVNHARGQNVVYWEDIEQVFPEAK